MNLEIRFDKGEGLNLYIDEISEHRYFDYKTRVQALRNANDRFDKELMKAASLFPQKKIGAFLWCYTSDFLRGENITDLVKIYFIIELVKELVKVSSVNDLKLSYKFPNDAIQEFSNIGLTVQKTTNYYNGIIREWFKVFYYTGIEIKKNFDSFKNKRNSIFEGNLLDVNKSPINNRLDSIENFHFYKPYKVFSGQEHSINGFDKNDVVVFRNENSIWDGLIVFIKTIQIALFTKSKKSSLPKVYNSFFRFRDSFRLWSLLLYERGASKYFERSKIIHLVHVSTLTKPEYRILWAKAKEYQIQITLASSRTLKKLSSSERLIKADIIGYSKTVLPDYFIVRDQFSKDVFTGFPFYHNVLIGGRFISNEEVVNKVVGNELVLYIVLTHIRDCSDYLLRELMCIDFIALGIRKIFFRSHPAVRYTVEEIANHFPIYEIFNHTGLSIQNCNYEKIIMISGPTTGSLELVKKGVSLFWFPYIWKDGILFDDIMRETGSMVNSVDDFVFSVKKFKTKNMHGVIFNHEIFRSNKLISEQIKSYL